MPSTNHLSSLPFSSTHNTATRYIFLAATIAAAVFSYSLVAKTNNNKRLTTLEMSTSTTSAASNTNATDMNGVPRVLHEIGDLMRHIFFEMRDLLYEGSVISVEIIDKDHKYRKISMKKQEGHIMCSPLILGSGGQEEWDNMEAVFAYMMCGHSVAWMWDVLKLLVRGRKWRVFEVIGNVRRCPLEARKIWIDHSGTNSRAAQCSHIFWLIKVGDGREFAFDLTAAQFGYHRTVTPYNEYKEILDFKETSREDPGTEFENLAAIDYGMSREDKLAKTVTRRLVNVVRGFVHENEGPVEPKALKEHLGDTCLDKIVVAAFANHRQYMRKGQYIYLRGHPKTMLELAKD